MDDLDAVLPHLGVPRSVSAFARGAPRCTQRRDLESGRYLRTLAGVRSVRGFEKRGWLG